jgi:CheY-like chemotaxis protein
MKTGAILVIDDDADDHLIIMEVIRELSLSNQLIQLYSGDALIEYLLGHATEQPFIILCDINIPKLNGIEIKKLLDSYPELKKKSIPWVYYSTFVSPPMLKEAYELGVQGFFTKKASLLEVTRSLKMIFDYWSECRHPNN